MNKKMNSQLSTFLGADLPPFYKVELEVLSWIIDWHSWAAGYSFRTLQGHSNSSILLSDGAYELFERTGADRPFQSREMGQQAVVQYGTDLLCPPYSPCKHINGNDDTMIRKKNLCITARVAECRRPATWTGISLRSETACTLINKYRKRYQFKPNLVCRADAATTPSIEDFAVPFQ